MDAQHFEKTPEARMLVREEKSPGSPFRTRAWLLRSLVALLVAMIVALCAAVLVADGPTSLIVGFAFVLLLVAILIKGYKVFYAYLVLLLLGYLFLGKGFAYVGAAPLYLGEVGLALAIMSAAMMILFGRLKGTSSFARPEVVLLLAFCGWGAFRTIPYLETYGIDALRDSVLWGYAAFALFILLLIPRESILKLFTLYGSILPFYLVWLLVAWVIMHLTSLSIYFPGAPVPLLDLKKGDVGVHLAGVAAYLLLRLDLRGPCWSSRKLWFLWGLWGVNWVLWGTGNRAGMLSALIGVAIVLVVKPRTRWYRPLVLATMIVGIMLVASPSLTYTWKAQEYELSAQQIAENIGSAFGKGDLREGTKQWRLTWWRSIIDDTFAGEYFWAGRGYGIDLAYADGYQTYIPPDVGSMLEQDSTRNPHNAHINILARSGVPGFTFWLLFLTSFGWMLASRLLRTTSTVDYWPSRYALWILAYWLAFLFNASFDVFLEGPMGGIWFWSLIGMSLVYFSESTSTTTSQHTPWQSPRRR